MFIIEHRVRNELTDDIDVTKCFADEYCMNDIRKR